MTKTTLNTGKKVFLVNGKRTPFGSFGGSLKDITPVDLAVHAGKAAMEELNLDPSLIDQVILGNVCPSSTDTLYGGRHLALKLGAKESTPGVTINRLCGSGIQAILDGLRLIKLNEAECVLCAGTENMSMVPHLTYGGRFGTKYGSLKNVDMLFDALTDQYVGAPMAITAENLAGDFKISRQECDEYSLDSHKKAEKAYAEGNLQDELVSIPLKRGECSKDEHLREGLLIENMAKLKPSFAKDGVVTPATASGVVDGACSVIVASEEFCKKNNLSPLAEIIDGKVVGVDPTRMGIGPVPAIKQLLESNNLSMSDIDLVEINEAFASQTLSCIKELDLDTKKLNIWGGAISIGHPLAASGARIALTLSRQLNKNNKKWGIASACIGGGQGISLLLKNE